MEFKLHSKFKPTGDQPQAIDYLVKGIKENKSSLKSFGVKYEQIDLIENEFDLPSIEPIVEENEDVVAEEISNFGINLENIPKDN